METNVKIHENRLRRLANKQGLRIEKSRIRYTCISNQGGYRLIDAYTNTLIDGVYYDMTLAEIEHALRKNSMKTPNTYCDED